MKTAGRNYASLSKEQKDRLSQGPSLADFITEDLAATGEIYGGYEGKLIKEKGMKRYWR